MIPGNSPEDDDYEVKVERLFTEMLNALCNTMATGLENVKPGFGRRKLNPVEISQAVAHTRDFWQHKWNSL